MKSTEEKAIVKDMQLASLKVLRQTARDVFDEKINASELSTKVVLNTNGDNNGDASDACLVEDNHENSLDTAGLPKIDEQELILGRVIGRGAFCVVRECSHASFPYSITRSESENSIEKLAHRIGEFGRHIRRRRRNGSNGSTLGNSSSSVESSVGENRRCLSRKQHNSNNRARYVVKQLSPELGRSDKINFLKGTVDLAMETRFLALLDHENIVSITGVSSNDAFSDGYFIILEKLNETLGKRVKVWMDMDRQCKGITGVFTGSKKKAKKLQSERISAARSLVAGMEFLHYRNIVFRDLKPDNIGFTIAGKLKIFDFGLAKELRDDEKVNDDLYRMTGCTGAIRYMSPENLQGKPYNQKTDIYSWAMIMWNMLALEPPFALYTEDMIIDRASKRGYRPKIFSTWSDRMSKTIKMSWSTKIDERPSFSEIAAELEDEAVEIESMNPEG